MFSKTSGGASPEKSNLYNSPALATSYGAIVPSDTGILSIPIVLNQREDAPPDLKPMLEPLAAPPLDSKPLFDTNVSNEDIQPACAIEVSPEENSPAIIRFADIRCDHLVNKGTVLDKQDPCLRITVLSDPKLSHTTKRYIYII